MGYYSYVLTDHTASYTCHLVVPNFTPRKIDPPKETKIDPEAVDYSAANVDTLIKEYKNALKEKLNFGQGNMTLQEWDNFLADLVEMGVISNDERMSANGILREIPDEAIKDGSYGFSSEHDVDLQFDLLWKGDPVQWLNDMDLYMLKYGLYANMQGHYADNSRQRAAYNKLIEIVKDILD